MKKSKIIVINILTNGSAAKILLKVNCTKNDQYNSGSIVLVLSFTSLLSIFAQYYCGSELLATK